jgi:hypothetical protein|tara:strand:- start:521 stop:1417 length:897 start_codon:yes stop_codon:yes gene_type:complete
MKKYIVTTTIQSPTEATIKYSQVEGWQLVVVGDKKTPHNEYENINCEYLHPDDQEDINKELSDAIGWNCIQRRNLGFLYSYLEGADVMATVDDDNIPYDSWGKEIYVGKEIEVDLYESANGYFDPLSVTEHSNLWHRGYPIEMVPSKNNVKHLGTEHRKVLVQADLWDGDPDIDAICRLSQQPEVKFSSISPFATRQLSPFNSQNTFLSREVLPYYMMYPNVGRMDDIWASYTVQKQFPNSVIYNKATVYQERNEHDIVLDLEREIIGYRNTLQLLEGKYDIPKDVQQSFEIYQNSFI